MNNVIRKAYRIFSPWVKSNARIHTEGVSVRLGNVKLGARGWTSAGWKFHEGLPNFIWHLVALFPIIYHDFMSHNCIGNLVETTVTRKGRVRLFYGAGQFCTVQLPSVSIRWILGAVLQGCHWARVCRRRGYFRHVSLRKYIEIHNLLRCSCCKI